MPDNFEPTAEIQTRIENNLKEVSDRIAAAILKSGRRAGAAQLVAVTKYAQPDWMVALFRAGVTQFGENRPQQLVERTKQFDPGINWHLIGQLQRNKVRPTLKSCGIIHSVDSIRLLDRIELIADELELKPRILLEVNVSGEESKSGFSAEQLKTLADQLCQYSQMEVCGLMTMAPIVSSPEQTRPVFSALRQLRDDLADSSELNFPELSMGMSGDFEIAIEEGATMVRVGSRLYQGCS